MAEGYLGSLSLAMGRVGGQYVENDACTIEVIQS